MTKLYLIGALKNPEIPKIANTIESWGYQVYDDWWSPGPETDQFWHKHETSRCRTYKEAINGPHAWNVFEFDRRLLDDSSGAVLVLPSGKSGHLELGYIIGCGKPGFILMDGEPTRWDVMYRFATDIVYNLKELRESLIKTFGA